MGRARRWVVSAGALVFALCAACPPWTKVIDTNGSLSTEAIYAHPYWSPPQPTSQEASLSWAKFEERQRGQSSNTYDVDFTLNKTVLALRLLVIAGLTVAAAAAIPSK